MRPTTSFTPGELRRAAAMKVSGYTPLPAMMPMMRGSAMRWMQIGKSGGPGKDGK
jgi:hypothetical protein